VKENDPQQILERKYNLHKDEVIVEEEGETMQSRGASPVEGQAKPFLVPVLQEAHKNKRKAKVKK